MRLPQGTILSGRYEIIEQIGLGGMAVVYRARDRKLDRDVTVKVMREEYSSDEDFIARFDVEARAAASLSNSNIVNVYDVGAEEDVHYIVMEYIDGVTLKDLIVKRAPFENEETLGVAIQIATALSHAHKNNIIHRDIKPQNIMVTKSGIVKVMDFGIARAASAATTTTTSNTMGSVHYFSPEQARGKFVDFRSDIYSLGIVMFEMATGQIPYDGDSAVTVALKHINEPLPDIKGLNPEVSESINRIILKATSKLSTQRYDTIDDMIADLKRAITNESGEFVQTSKGFDSPTITIGGEDLRTIREGAEHRAVRDGGEYPDDADYDEDYDDEDAIDKSTERKIIIAAILTAVAIIALISAIGFNMINKRKPVMVNVPPLRGLTLEKAEETLQEYGLGLGDHSEGESDDFGVGLIISQDPAADAQVEEGSRVSVVISKGVEKVEVPNVVNDIWDMEGDINQLRKLADLGLNVYIVREYSDTYTVGAIISQDPAAGQMVDPGSTITLTVSQGVENRTVIVPDLSGRTEAQAVTLLESRGLTPGTPEYHYSEEVEEGYVIEQLTRAGSEVAENSTIGFLISRGPRPDAAVSEEPTDSPQAQLNTQEVLIKAPQKLVSEEEIQVNIKVLQIRDGYSETLVDQVVDINAFPMPVTISGNGMVMVSVYVDDEYEASDTYDLSSEGGQ